MSYVEEHNIKAFCLDVDGTLYPRRQMNVRLVRSAFPSLSIGLRFNGVRKKYRMTQESNPPREDSRRGLLEKQASLFLENKSDKDSVENMIKKMDKQFYKSWAKSFLSIKAYPNMVEALTLAKEQGIKIAVLSDFPLEKKLETLGIAHLVDFALSSEDTGYLKPSNKAFDILCKGVGERPENCLYFGDSYDKDIIGGSGFNMHTLYIKKTSHKEKYPKASIICGNWKDVIKLTLR
jgi:putative hydrolase of the HAD superfamily